MVAQQPATSFQLRIARKFKLGKHFFVKEHLKPSFIDRAADLNHIRVRRGPDVASRKAISRTGDDGASPWGFFDTPDKENIMIHKSTYSNTRNRLRHAVCAFGLLLSFAALPAFGQHVHQLSYNGSTWANEQLPSAQTTVITSIASIVTAPNNQEHVYYFAGDSPDVHQLFYNGTNWADEDLTAETGAPQANPFSVAAFSVGNYQYVYYVDLYGDVHQLLYNNSGWADTDLTEIAGGPQARGQLVAFTTSPAVHVFYTEGDNNDVHQIFNTNGTNWQDQDLTVVTGGATVGGEGVSGFNIGNYQYIYFLDGSGHVHQYLYNNFNWSDEDLTALTESLPAQFGNSVAAFVVPGTKKLRVYVQAENLHILQLASTNNVKWSSSDLTKKTKASVGYPGTSIAGFSTANKQLQVYYDSEQSHLNQFLLPAHATTWQNSDLMPGPIGGVVANSGIAGFSLQNLPYVFYEGD
jgi:hypothetical protein